MAVKLDPRDVEGRSALLYEAEPAQPVADGESPPFKEEPGGRPSTDDRAPGLTPRQPSDPESLTTSLRTEQYMARKGLGLEECLLQAQIAAAKSFRLLSIARSVQRTLAECIRSEDKQGFVTLFASFRNATCQSSLSGRDLSSPFEGGTLEMSGYPESFVDALPAAQQATVLDLLSRLRSDDSFLAERLSSMNHESLLRLLPKKNFSKYSESVFESSIRSGSRVSQGLGYVVDGQTDQIASFEASSPLEALIWSTSDLKSELCFEAKARNIWAVACARLVSDHRRGMERVIPAILDAWTTSTPWPGRKRLEDWIGSVLQDGSFILDQPSRQSFRVRVQGRHDQTAEEELKVEAFLSNAVRTLLELLADPDGASVIPDGALDLAGEIHSRIATSGQRDAFCDFLLTRWLCNSFIVDAVTLPEVRGPSPCYGRLTDYLKAHCMCTDRYISDQARQRVLREIVVRAQRAVYHALHPWYVAATSSC